MTEGRSSLAGQITANVATLAISYVGRARGPDGVRVILERAGIERMLALLADPGLWIDYAEAMAVVELAASICAEDDIGYRLGEETARVLFEHGRLQPFRGRPFAETVSALVALLAETNSTRRLDLESATDDGYARIISVPLNRNEDRFTCRFGTGFLTAVPAYLGRTGVATELQCVTQGADSCVLEVHWARASADFGSATTAGVAPATVQPESGWVTNLDIDARTQLIKDFVNSSALPRQAESLRVSLISENGEDEITYTRGATISSGGAAFTASIDDVPGFRGSVTIDFAGAGLPAIDQRFAESCAEQISMILSSATTESELYARARRDPLTGLANRVKLEELAGTVTDGTTVIFFDLNGFKLVNDEMGHDAGDKLLAELGHRLQQAARTNDVIARYGGDEFVAVIEGTQSADAANVVARRLQDTFVAPVDLDGQPMAISASWGIARAPDDGCTLAELITIADERMYTDKQR